MNINSEEEARAAVDQWRNAPLRAQQANLKLAMESLELSQMYYEQKGNDQAIARAAACIAILEARLQELLA
ncbi:MAG: hypothetical protein ACOY3Z_07010 [Thermodesulfobacteriota bacterium]